MNFSRTSPGRRSAAEGPVRVANVVGTAVVAFLAACGRGSGNDVKPLAPRAKQADEMIDIFSTTATVRGVQGLRPRCPVNPHAEARMVVRGVAGVVQYRWERSDGTAGPLTQFIVKPSTANGISVEALRPDDWTDNQRGRQLTIAEHVHVTFPFDFHSAPVTLNVMCY